MDLSLSDTLVVKRENLFLVSPRDGSLAGDGAHPFGLWRGDARHLSLSELTVNGRAPLLLAASDARGTRSLQHLRDGALSVRRERLLRSGSVLEERLTLGCHGAEPLALRLELRLAADFESMLVVRGLAPRVERPAARVDLLDADLRFSLEGRDGVVRTTTVALSEAPAARAADERCAALAFELELPPGGRHELALELATAESGDARVARPAARPERTTVRSDDELFDRVLGRSLQDLALLRSELDGRDYYAAGLPWYATLFGRDSLIAALQALAFEPAVAADTLRLLAGLQGRERSDERDEEPGKIIHELRVGEPATLGETAFARYYGSADATALWLLLLCCQCDWSGSLGLFEELRPQVDAALEWIERAAREDGLVRYRRRNPGGLLNQGWRDSPDGVPGADGRPLEPPIALIEVQAYVASALERTAALFERSGEPAHAEQLRARAERTKAALERFWLAESGSYAIGLDAQGRAGSGLTSNPGHLLWAGVLPPERADRVRDALMGDALFSGWGVRTLADAHPGYDPLGYHSGSVWPHDNALLAAGLRRHGHDEDFGQLFEALLEAASRFPDLRLPELYGGYERVEGEDPVPYPVACRPQAWAAGTIPYLLTVALGLQPEGLGGRLRIVRPRLPRWLGRVELRGLRVAGACVDLRFERAGDAVALADARVDGELDVVVEGAGAARIA